MGGKRKTADELRAEADRLDAVESGAGTYAIPHLREAIKRLKRGELAMAERAAEVALGKIREATEVYGND